MEAKVSNVTRKMTKSVLPSIVLDILYGLKYIIKKCISFFLKIWPQMHFRAYVRNICKNKM